MKRKTILTLSLTLFLTLLFISNTTKADEYLIKEMEDLYSSLEYNDPAKAELTLRLADLYFDISIKEGSSSELDEKRRRSLLLYKNALEGDEGVEKAKGQLKIKVQFQMARLLVKLRQERESVALFLDVYTNSRDKNLKREAAFQLAQWYEKEANFEQTDTYYQAAIALCNSVDSCNYAHYKRAWVLYKETRLEEGINELKLSLWDSKGQIRDKVLNDYIMFLSNRITNGQRELKEIESLAKKVNRPEILRQLAESYFTAGNRLAGSLLLGHIDKKTPSLYFQVRLLEENYGLDNWDKVSYYISKLQNKSAQDIPVNKQEASEVTKILRRFIVQLDAETQTDKKYNQELKKTILIYLAIFPNDELRRKMQEGWLKAESSPSVKIQQLAKWIDEDIALGISAKEIRKLRQSRLVLGQQQKISDIIISESLAIAKIVDSSEAREFEYVAARQMYEIKQFESAQKIFKKLADSSLTLPKVDKWGLMSQNLLLDIYNQKKMFQAIIDQSQKWISHADHLASSKIKSELQQMAKISQQAKFEWAVSQGETKNAMDVFYDYCMQNIFADKSCVNAKVLAIKLSDQDKLITLLEKAKDEDSLMSEYELMGKFADAARLQEKILLPKNKDVETYLKIALLYELDYDFKSRDRILNKLIARLIKNKKIESKFEKAIYVTLDEANLLNQKTLRIPWSTSFKLRLAHGLQVEKPNNITKKLLIEQKNSVGPAWSKLILSKVQPLDRKQRKIAFYGRRSKYLFQKRTKAIERFATEAKVYLDGADVETRIYLLDMLAKSYIQLSKDIHATPLPDGLDDETLTQVKNQLQTMALPFEEVANDYTRLLKNELNSMTDVANKNRIEGNLLQEDPNYASFITVDPRESLNVASLDYTKARELKGNLHHNPNKVDTLEGLESFYKEHKSERIASYFTGRINSLKKQEQL